jgi:hypothetical protein
MSERPAPSDPRTATNQAPALVGHNVVTSDRALTDALARHGTRALVEELAALGAEAGSEEAREHGRLANRHHPELRTYVAKCVCSGAICRVIHRTLVDSGFVPEEPDPPDEARFE